MTAGKPSRGLGRGLSAILGESTDISGLRKPVGYVNKEIAGSRTGQNSSDIFRIPLDRIEPNPFQPRTTFDREALEELAGSISTFGLIQPVTVRRIDGDRYQIISGERRFRACRMAGLEMIPAYIREADNQGMLEMAIVENIQRENLDPIEVAMSYRRLIEECGLTQEQMASRVGRKRASVTNYLRLLKLPAKVQHDLKVGLISVGHAKVLLGVEDPSVQEALCDAVVRNSLSVRQLEEKLARLYSAPAPAVQQPLPDAYYKVLEHIGRFFGDNISLKRSPTGKGTITIRFSSDEEVEKFLKALDER
ncbi:MAG: ParB/RepB/Spo0J family partition protein [Bacteroidales bacterium]|nr:ParB/RepB/Spo0J family partition protein [Bacteroidales bacterium]